jgi:hypothetical protein
MESMRKVTRCIGGCLNSAICCNLLDSYARAGGCARLARKGRRGKKAGYCAQLLVPLAEKGEKERGFSLGLGPPLAA